MSTTHRTYEVTSLTTGVDGRVVRSVYAGQTDVWHYDPSSSTSGQAGSSVSVTDVSDVEFAGAPVSLNRTSSLALLGGEKSLSQQTRTTVHLDSLGNLRSTTDHGLLGVDTPIEQNNKWIAVDGDWNWQIQETSIGYNGLAQRTYSFVYDTHGNETSVSAVLSGTETLPRSVNVPPVDAASNGTFQVSTASYDLYGNVKTSAGVNGYGESTFTYDPSYQQLLIQKRVYPNGLAGPGALTSTFAYDRGFEEVTGFRGVDDAATASTYDLFGRLFTLSLPEPFSFLPDAVPDFTLNYVTVPGGPLQYVTTTQVLDAVGTPSRQSYVYTDALGRKVLTMSTGGAADPPGTWICTGLTQRDAKGQVSAVFAPYAVTTEPGNLAPAPSGGKRTFGYDPFGRTQSAYDLDGTLIGYQRFHALSRDAFDYYAYQSQLTYSTQVFDGHGRLIEVEGRTENGGGTTGTGPDTISTKVVYQATGEPLSIRRSSLTQPAVYERSMVYDSLGRMVGNFEPNTSTLVVGPGPEPGVTRGWTYAYDLNGQLVGTADARGCGINFTHDGLGRELSEDYIPCESSQAPYSSPSAGGAGTEVFNIYDAPEPGEDTLNVGPSPVSLRGRLSASYSRGEHTDYAYDRRGRAIQIARQMPLPNAERATGALENRSRPRGTEASPSTTTATAAWDRRPAPMSISCRGRQSEATR